MHRTDTIDDQPAPFPRGDRGRRRGALTLARRPAAAAPRAGTARCAGSARAARSRCSTTIPTGSAKKFGYFGDIETTLEPGPMDATATSSSSTRTRPTWAIPRPACSRSASSRASRSSRSGTWARSTSSTSPSARARSRRTSRSLEGKTILLGSAGWQSICDPMLAPARRRPASVNYAEAGGLVGPGAEAGPGRRRAVAGKACARSGKARGSISTTSSAARLLEAAGQQLRHPQGDFEDPAKKALYEPYLRGWAMGLEFGHQNPRAATQIVLEQFPALASQMKPDGRDRIA